MLLEVYSSWCRRLSRVWFTFLEHMRVVPVVVACTCLVLSISTLMLRSQTLKNPKPPDARNGEHIYKTGCIACHGEMGKGAPQTSTEFRRPDTFPDFTQCSGTTAEPNAAWKAIIGKYFAGIMDLGFDGVVIDGAARNE